MLVTDSIEEIRNTVRLWKREKLKVGFVPTMGALHDGHLALVRQAKKNSDRVVVSIFVNPEQFGPNEDFENYPRQLDDDLKLCRKNKAAAVFTPEELIMYPGKSFVKIEINDLNRYMCGASRPGFFEGVLLVVNKLINIIEPDMAVFGQKDIQQFLIIQQMMKEFNHGVDICKWEKSKGLMTALPLAAGIHISIMSNASGPLHSTDLSDISRNRSRAVFMNHYS